MREHTLTRQIARQLMRQDAERMAVAAGRPKSWREFLPEAKARFARVQSRAKAQARITSA
jgi:hypothetical protein